MTLPKLLSSWCASVWDDSRVGSDLAEGLLL
jgi:hypothetical protein